MTAKTSSRPTAAKSITATDAARIQSATAKISGGGVTKDSFPARAQSAVAKSSKR